MGYGLHKFSHNSAVFCNILNQDIYFLAFKPKKKIILAAHSNKILPSGCKKMNKWLRNCEVCQFSTVMQYCAHKIAYDNFTLAVQFNHQDKKEIEMISVDQTQHLCKVECICDFSLSFCAVGKKMFLSFCPHFIPIITEVFGPFSLLQSLVGVFLCWFPRDVPILSCFCKPPPTIISALRGIYAFRNSVTNAIFLGIFVHCKLDPSPQHCSAGRLKAYGVWLFVCFCWLRFISLLNKDSTTRIYTKDTHLKFTLPFALTDI